MRDERRQQAVVLPLLEAWCAIRNRAAELDRLLRVILQNM
jgi:hypothetical protein